MTEGKGFAVLDDAEYVGAICAKGCANYTRKQLDQLTDFVKRPQIGAKGMMWVKIEEDGSIKSSVSKFYTEEELRTWDSLCAKNDYQEFIKSSPCLYGYSYFY